MPEITRRGFVAALGGGAVASGAGVAALVTGWADVPHVKTRGRGRWTRFGTVAVLGASRRQLTGVGAGSHHHPASGLTTNGHVPASHRTWSGMVRVDVEVHNGTDRPILVSPGQFRLRLGSTGPTVTPYDAGWEVGPLAASGTIESWVDYLAPPGGGELWVEYVDPAATAPQAFAIVARELS